MRYPGLRVKLVVRRCILRRRLLLWARAMRRTRTTIAARTTVIRSVFTSFLDPGFKRYHLFRSHDCAYSLTLIAANLFERWPCITKKIIILLLRILQDLSDCYSLLLRQIIMFNKTSLNTVDQSRILAVGIITRRSRRWFVCKPESSNPSRYPNGKDYK